MFLGKTCNDNDTAMLALAQVSESTSLLSPGPHAHSPSLTGMNCHTTAMEDPMMAIHTTLTALGTLTR